MSTTQADKSTLSIVIPAYNERGRLERTLGSIAEYGRQSGSDIELIVVDDGSEDGTDEVARAFDASPVRLRVLVNDTNYGKGYSVRRGMLEAAGDELLMSDADLSTPIEEVEKLRRWLGAEYALVIGSREMPESQLSPPQGPFRRLLNIVFRAFRRLLMLPEIRDTQCGFKLFRRDAARRVFEHVTEPGFAFDCEVLGLARQFGYCIKEVGVVWRNDRNSTVHPMRDVPKMVWSLLSIRRRLHRLKRPAAST